MQRPANKAPASGPTITAGKALARDLATGQFIGTDGHGRSAAERRVIAARRAEVARLYPDMTCAEIGGELGWSAPAIWKDVKALGLEPRRAGTRRRYPALQVRRLPASANALVPLNGAGRANFRPQLRPIRPKPLFPGGWAPGSCSTLMTPSRSNGCTTGSGSSFAQDLRGSRSTPNPASSPRSLRRSHKREPFRSRRSSHTLLIRVGSS